MPKRANLTTSRLFLSLGLIVIVMTFAALDCQSLSSPGVLSEREFRHQFHFTIEWLQADRNPSLRHIRVDDSSWFRLGLHYPPRHTEFRWKTRTAEGNEMVADMKTQTIYGYDPIGKLYLLGHFTSLKEKPISTYAEYRIQRVEFPPGTSFSVEEVPTPFNEGNGHVGYDPPHWRATVEIPLATELLTIKHIEWEEVRSHS